MAAPFLRSSSAGTAAPPFTWPLRLRVSPVAIRRVAGSLALLGILAGCLVVAVAAAQHRSMLAPPIKRHPPAWLTWPFHGLWHDVPRGRMNIQVFLLIVLLVMLACYLAAIACSKYLSPRVVWIAVGAVYFVLFLAPPLLMTDVFNYIGYARMGVLHDLNPYTHFPAENRADTLVYHLSNWHHLKSPYGPLFTLITYTLVPLGVAGAYWTYKALILAAGIGCLMLVAHLARRLGRSPTRAVVLVGLNPIVLIYGQGGQHNDVITVGLTLAALALLYSKRDAVGGAAMSLAAAAKASSAAFVPVFVAGAARRLPALAGAVAGAVVLGAVSLAFFGPHIPAVGIQSRMVSPLSVPNVIGYLFLPAGGVTAGVRAAIVGILAVAAVACFVYAWRRRDPLGAMGWLTLVVLVTASWDMPWYLLWLLPFLALSTSRRFRVAAVLVAVYLTVQWLPLTTTALHYKLRFMPNTAPAWKVNKAYLAGHLR